MKQFTRLLAAAGVAASSLVGANTNNTIVGTLPGDVTVTKSGAANYRIPIEVPPGINGLQPNLALVYDSQKRNGLLGVGWKLTGISSITRCPTTLAQDGFIDGVDFDDNDKFCLNGDRLVAVNGGTYGASGTEYRTEYASYRKIVSYGSAGNGPTYFKVWYKDGRIAEFGNTEDSLVEAQGKNDALSWAINKVEDRFGNTINFNYSENNATGEHYPASVVYAGTTLEFNFEERPDSIYGYVAGSKYQTTKRLKKATIHYLDKSSHYNVDYQHTAKPEKSLIKSVQHCADQCLPATRVQWQKNNAEDSTFTPKKLLLKDFGQHATWQAKEHVRRLVDVNGDGLTDIVGIGHPGVYVSYGDGKSFSPKKHLLADFGQHATWRAQDHIRQLVDVNGDGLTDIVGIGHPGVYVSYGDGKSFSPKKHLLADFGQHATWRAQDHVRQLVDVNGDGLTDIVGIGDPGVYVSYGDGKSFSPKKHLLLGSEVFLD
ncbi:SpvB/TcaC N-terminal domain-containing protein [Spartinivicinus poritis]|uniref:Uncharacterized protein n=1 Tax=Spartinivicinus poritis TaxID=2994640 RepID=A0ABT5UF09_9GAMM|nr:SpvB/TcaC N-terminal domain-containing protein [Spartinivicinus sp. A2-2]MDE1464053.1 hypothetical protein [Spartinivicinus sp. A2-2]